MALPGTSVVVFGPKSAGKSCVLAQLCQQLSGFPQEQLQQCRSLAKDLGRPPQQYAWMLDSTREERECGQTLEPSLCSFSSSSFTYTGIDTPGADGLFRSVVSSLSLGDVAALVLPANSEYDAHLNSGTIRELCLAAFTMGMKNIIVLVNKMDDMSISDPSARFDEIKKVVLGFLKEVGFKQKEFPFVPVSGLLGDGLTNKSADLGWYAGKTVVEVLDGLGPMARPAEKPLRFPVLKVLCHEEAGTVVVGRVETGSLRTGSKVAFCPSGYVADIKTMRKNGEQVSEASGGDIVSVALGDQIAAEVLHRGMVAGSPSSDPVAEAETFIAQVVVLDHPGCIRSGYCPVMVAHTAQIPCELEELQSIMDRKTKEAKPNPEQVKSGEVVVVKMRPRRGICLESFSAYPALGRFALRDHGRTVAVGVVKEVTKRPVAKARTSDDS
mmetsp:Transcript_89223/g.186471  ORF Transcript_89223/g.186471 Transcript_89223/m.186471 type:complete len:440 (-) Transcript_89223:61-1380(-)|eukprot:CAMPEP_0206495966 /NCGR_PEP_ID=MMETSP0324_2-20121206/49031_1 /ASSEMBLY_ACC=CAM_ASM_000836 /TAXON_ID=2866 /ORGANISM="Crypthecodinium cohnii, Strain Seligo" /LENGTH=439 /DNA_ID=CAMNT_0053980699 /DNA_START=213 /DNA_END=1532 /DNA_ORIENTATION=-